MTENYAVNETMTDIKPILKISKLRPAYQTICSLNHVKTFEREKKTYQK